MREPMRVYAYSVQLFILTSTYMHTKVKHSKPLPKKQRSVLQLSDIDVC